MTVHGYREAPAVWPVDGVKVEHETVCIVEEETARDRALNNQRSMNWAPLVLEIPLKDFWTSLREPGLWTLAAMGSGVIGNITYDSLKKFASRIHETFPEDSVSAGAIQQIALLAVRARCAEQGLPAPPFSTLRVESCELRNPRRRAALIAGMTPYWEVKVVSDDGTLRASLDVPHDGQGVDMVDSSLTINLARRDGNL